MWLTNVPAYWKVENSGSTLWKEQQERNMCDFFLIADHI